MSQPAGLLAIGRFAQLTRLSAKQLRRYDELGLLAPAVVDPDSGYRFYHPRQARTAATIALLRELDVPLGVVRELLVADEERAAALLAAERERRAAELERVARAVATLGRLAGDGALPDVTVRVREEPARTLAAVRAPADPERMVAVTRQLARRLGGLVPDSEVPFTGLFPVELADAFDVVVGVETAGPLAGTEVVRLPDGPTATAVHDGTRDTLALTWWPLLAWVHERGLAPAGPLRERYLDPHLTHLTVPLEGAP
jgi:DNA-binding transcriptional MerR regulator